jgi:hypothetical protein
MKQNISSKWTLPTKIFNFLMAVFPLVPLIAAYREIAADELPTTILVVALVALWSLFFLWINRRLKFVSVDENNLYVSRLLREKTIPLSEVEDVRLTTIGFVWVGIYFKSKTAFGKKIFFMPTIEKSFVFSFQRYHPVVDELKNLAKAD